MPERVPVGEEWGLRAGGAEARQCPESLENTKALKGEMGPEGQKCKVSVQTIGGPS